MGNSHNLAVAIVVAAAGCGVSATSHAQYEARSDWESYTDGYLNISVFVFRDANRNGAYDLGDRPMSGIQVDAVGNGKTESAISNTAGFANFRMSASNTDMEITFPGRYEFQTLIPEGWAATTESAVQAIDFELFPGSPADMVAKPPPALVGLAPDLSIEGWVTTPIAELHGPDGQAVTVTADADGRFRSPVYPGTWAVRSATGRPRQILVGSNPVVLADVYLESEQPACGDHLITVTFDDLLIDGILKVPSGYAGIGWDNVVMTPLKFYGSEGYRNTAMSGEFLAYNGSGHPAGISDTEPFDFVGGFFGASTLRAEGETLTVRAWRGADIAYEQRLTLSALGARHLLADFNCVTRLEFETEHYWQFTFDDLEFRVSD